VVVVYALLASEALSSHPTSAWIGVDGSARPVALYRRKHRWVAMPNSAPSSELANVAMRSLNLSQTD
jgi:hypothetical protein